MYICLSEGATALHMASQIGHKAVIEMLLDKGASVDKPTMVTNRLAFTQNLRQSMFHPYGIMGPHRI